jgi:hypothetical protein
MHSHQDQVTAAPGRVTNRARPCGLLRHAAVAACHCTGGPPTSTASKPGVERLWNYQMEELAGPALPPR